MDTVRIGGIASLVILLSACGWFADPDELFAQAQQAYADADYREARVRLQALLEQAPERADAHYLLAKTHLASGKPNAALRALVTAEGLGLSGGEIQLTHARALLGAGKPEAVIERLPTAAELEAVGDGKSLLLLGEAQARLGQWESAKLSYREAAGFQETALEAWVALGRISLAKNDLEAVHRHLEKAAGIASDDRRTRLLAGDLALAQRRPGAAQQAFSSILEMEYEERAATGLIRALLAEGDIAAAKAEVDRLAEAFPETLQSFFYRAVIAEATGDHESAIRHANRVYQLWPNFVPGLLILGRAHHEQGYTSIARQYLEQAYQLDPENPQVRLQLARFSDSVGEPERVIDLLAPLPMHPEALEPRLLLLRAYMKAGKTGAAAELAAELEPFAPANADTTAVVAEVALARNDFKKAQGLLEAGLEENPQSNRLTFLLGKALFAQDDTAGAISTWKRLLTDSAGHIAARRALVSAYLKMKRYAEVEEHIRVLLKQPSTDLRLQVLLGDVLKLQGDHESAIAVYNEAYAEKPTGQIAVKRYEALTAAGDESAHRTLERHLQRQPKDDRVRILLAQVHQAAGRAESSIDEYEKVLARHPEQPLVLNNLAWLYYESGNDQAKALAEKAFQLVPDSPEIADTLAQILMGEGRVERALPLLEKAWGARPGNPEIGYRASLAYVEAGRPEKARSILDGLLASENPFPSRKKAEALRAGL